MSAQLKALYELQQIDLALVKAQKLKMNLDDGTLKRQQIEAARAKADEAEKSLHEASSELHDKNLNLQSVESKRKHEKEKLYGGKVTGAKELESMEKEIEMLGRQKGTLEERSLELMDIVEERKVIAAAAQAALKKEEDALLTILEKRKHDDAILSKKMIELKAMREKAAPNVDSVLLKRYEALRPRSGGVVISKVVDSSCTACHTQITGGSYRDLQNDKEMVTCENCGRILYLEKP